MVKAWYMQSKPANPREECHIEPREFVSLDKLASIGVLYDYVNPSKRDAELPPIESSRGFNYHDEIRVSPKTLPDYEEKTKFFFEEHLHTDDEVRYVIEGCGYFDVRDTDDRWIRIKSEAGDLITLPAGIYHRFSPDTEDYIFVRRLFKGEPIWTAHFRGDTQTPKMPIRQEYAQKFQIGA